MKMKNVVIVAGLGLVGIYAAKKLIDRRNRKAVEANDDVVEENVNEEINEEVEQPKREWTVEDPEFYEDMLVQDLPGDAYIVPPTREDAIGRAVNGNMQGAVEFKRPKLRKIIWIGLYVLNIVFNNWSAVKCMIGIDLIGLICRLIAKLVNKNENK